MIGVVLGTGWKDQIDLPPGLFPIIRRHLYDSYTVNEIASPILAAVDQGVTTIILTNACGALSPDLEVGEIVCLSDHLNLTGECPDVGFAPMAGIYTQVGDFRTGVYAQVRGPGFETPAEARWLRSIGADVVGMSTAIEAIAAHAFGCRVIGLSLVTNVAATTAGHPDVLACAASVDLAGVLSSVVEQAYVYDETENHSQQERAK